MKKILIYNYNEPCPEQGGMERVTDSLATMLVQAGYEVLLLSVLPNRMGKQYDPPCGLRIVGPGDDLAGRLKESIVHFAPDVLIDQSECLIGYFGFWKLRPDFLQSIKLIGVVHNSYRTIISSLFISAQNKGLIHRIIVNLKIKRANYVARRKYRSIAGNYDYLVTLSEGFFPELIDVASSLDGKLVVIPNPLTFEEVDLLAEEKQNELLFVGRMDNVAKGIDRLLRVWSRIMDRLPEWQLILVGDGQDREMLEQYARSLKLERCRFVGYQSPADYYRRAKIFCMTSSYEGFGMVLTEAMQFGTVPIAFDSYPAVRDIIQDGVSGCLVKPFDECLYADQLERLMNSADLKLLSENARRSTQKFSRKNILMLWEQLFKI